MQITFFGFLWLIILILSLIPKKNNFIFGCLLFSMVLQCDNVITISGMGVGPQVITCIVFLAKALLTPNKKIKYTIGKQTAILLFLIIWIVLTVFVNESTISLELIFRIIQIGLYFLCFIKLARVRDSISKNSIYKTIDLLTIFLLTMGIIQFLMSCHIIPKFSIIRILFYNDSSESIAFNISGVYERMCSTLMEPSFFAPIIVSLFLYFLHKNNKKAKDYIILSIIVIEIILTKSSTAFAAFLVVTMIFAYKNYKRDKFIIFACSYIVIFGFIYWTGLFDDVILNKLSTASGITRTRLNDAAFDLFLANPFFGNGYKSSSASSLIFTLLAETGIIGTLLYFCFALYSLKTVVKYQKQKESIFSWMFIVAVFCQFLAGSQLDLSSFWLIAFIYSINLSKYEGTLQLSNHHLKNKINWR